MYIRSIESTPVYTNYSFFYVRSTLEECLRQILLKYPPFPCRPCAHPLIYAACMGAGLVSVGYHDSISRVQTRHVVEMMLTSGGLELLYVARMQLSGEHVYIWLL